MSPAIVDLFKLIMLMTPQGTLDILVQRTGEQGGGTNSFIHNNFFYDAFFLKAMGKLCSAWTSGDLSFSLVLNRPCDGGQCTMKNGTKYEVSVNMVI
jgi:integrin alpha FG-GAP repeat containing protein 1